MLTHAQKEISDFIVSQNCVKCNVSRENNVFHSAFLYILLQILIIGICLLIIADEKKSCGRIVFLLVCCKAGNHILKLLVRHDPSDKHNIRFPVGIAGYHILIRLLLIIFERNQNRCHCDRTLIPHVDQILFIEIRDNDSVIDRILHAFDLNQTFSRNNLSLLIISMEKLRRRHVVIAQNHLCSRIFNQLPESIFRCIVVNDNVFFCQFRQKINIIHVLFLYLRMNSKCKDCRRISCSLEHMFDCKRIITDRISKIKRGHQLYDAWFLVRIQFKD